MPIDMSLAAAKAPPRKNASGTRRALTAAPETKSITERRAEGLSGLAQLGQGLCLMLGQYADAAALGRHFEPVAIETAKLAERYDVIAKPIDVLIEVGPFGAFIAALMPLGLQLAANHGWIDAERVASQGVVPPSVLEAQMKAEMARMQAQAMQAQRQAMMDAQQAQREYESMMAEAA